MNRVSLIQSGTVNNGQRSSTLHCVIATDKITGEQVLMECENVIVAADPETSRVLLLTGDTHTHQLKTIFIK